ncbi:MAG: inositol monophosphatase family protein [Promethearchaeota archaeon]
MVNWIDTLETIARSVEEKLKPILGTPEAGIEMGIGAGGDVSKNIDVIAEKIIIDQLSGTGVPLKVITEEKGVLFLNGADERDYDLLVVIDPVDGSFNATVGVPVAAVSIAILDGSSIGDALHAVVLNLYTGGVFKASKGKGAWFNDKPLVIKDPRQKLEDCVIGIDINVSRDLMQRSEFIEKYKKIINAPRKLRVLGCNAISTALVASGSLDCFMDIRGAIRPLDIVGATLCIKEAGGSVYNLVNGQAEIIDTVPVELDQRIYFLAVSCDELKDDIINLLAG